MATLAPGTAPVPTEQAERRFHLIMALVIAATIVAGFSLNLAMGRSSFAVPAIVHVHAGVFFAWVMLYIAQTGLIASGNVALHKRLGIVSVLLVPIMLVVGTTMMIATAQRTGGPFFFAQNVFLFSNTALLYVFAGLVFWALRVRRYSGWHRRLMLVAMIVMSGPGIGRLLPMPLLIPHSWTVSVLSTLIFLVPALIFDWRRHGRVHPAYLWGSAVYLGVFALSLMVAETSWAVEITRDVVSGTPGGERPMAAFLPPGFTM